MTQFNCHVVAVVVMQNGARKTQNVDNIYFQKMLLSPALRLLPNRHSPRLVLAASAHKGSKSNFLNKDVKSKKYKGRLEYLNRQGGSI